MVLITQADSHKRWKSSKFSGTKSPYLGTFDRFSRALKLKAIRAPKLTTLPNNPSKKSRWSILVQSLLWTRLWKWWKEWHRSWIYGETLGWDFNQTCGNLRLVHLRWKLPFRSKFNKLTSRLISTAVSPAVADCFRKRANLKWSRAVLWEIKSTWRQIRNRRCSLRSVRMISL